MRPDRAIDIMAREIIAEADDPAAARVIYSPIGRTNFERVIERVSEIRTDLSPSRESLEAAWNLLTKESITS